MWDNLTKRLDKIDNEIEFILKELRRLEFKEPKPPRSSDKYEEEFQEWFRENFVPGCLVEQAARNGFDALISKYWRAYRI